MVTIMILIVRKGFIGLGLLNMIKSSINRMIVKFLIWLLKFFINGSSNSMELE